jgi:hypothetical protein
MKTMPKASDRDIQEALEGSRTWTDASGCAEKTLDGFDH